MSPDAVPAHSAARRRHPVIRFLSSVWFGVSLLALIVVYSSVLSALPPVRWALELTEMQAFRHWCFVTLVALLAVSILAATLFRTRWSVANAGALVTHAGLLTLIGGAAAYFGAKVEGDVLLQAPAVLVRATVGDQSRIIGRLRAEPGAQWARVLPHLGQVLRVEVGQTQATGVRPATAATVTVQLGDAESRTLTLHAEAGDWQPIHDSLAIGLAAPPPQQWFYDDELPALYIRNLATAEEHVRPIERLPIHRERYLPDGEDLQDAAGRPVPSHRTRPEISLLGLRVWTGWFETWRMPIAVDADGLPFAIEITGYVPRVVGLRPAGGAGAARDVPVLEVRERRQAGLAPRALSAVRVRLTGRGPAAGWSQVQWCLFSQYPDVDAHPLQVELPGGAGTWELVYSRFRHPLGAALAAARASVRYFPGQRSIEAFRSDVLVQAPGQPVRAATVSTNETVTIGPWTLYQSGFDFDEHWRYTVLGVGNRAGMLPMNIGWITVTLGCLYAFYVKPALLRRARERL